MKLFKRTSQAERDVKALSEQVVDLLEQIAKRDREILAMASSLSHLGAELDDAYVALSLCLAQTDPLGNPLIANQAQDS